MKAAGVGPAGFVADDCANAEVVIFGMRKSCEGSGPGDVAVTVGVVVVTAFGENPFCAGEGFSECKKVG